MRIGGTLAAIVLANWMLLAPSGLSQHTARASGQAAYVPVNEYDPARDAAGDIVDAIAEAKRTNRNVLLEVGGQWCVWCRILDKFFADHKDLLTQRERNYVMVKVNFSPENKNEQVLSRYPKIEGYPHLFVLDAGGMTLHSQPTGELEAGRSYNEKKMRQFLEAWAPKK